MYKTFYLRNVCNGVFVHAYNELKYVSVWFIRNGKSIVDFGFVFVVNSTHGQIKMKTRKRAYSAVWYVFP